VVSSASQGQRSAPAFTPDLTSIFFSLVSVIFLADLESALRK
jgi:hypothetical protein